MKYSEKEKVSKDERDEEGNGGFRLRNLIVFVILFLAVIATSLFMYLKSKNVDLENISLKDIVNELMDISGNNGGNKVVKEIEFGTNEKHVFAVSKGLIIKCVKNRVIAMNEEGEEQWVVPIFAANPVVKTAGSYIMVANLEGKEVYLLSGKTVKWDRKMDGNIINADVNESGYVSVVRQEKGYRGAVTVMNKNGAQAINTKIAKKFIFMSKVSPSGKQFAINGFDASGVKPDAVVELHDFSKNNGVNLDTGDVSLFPFVEYLNNGDLAAAGDSSVYLYDGEGKVKWTKKFDNKKIMCTDLLSGDLIVVALSDMDSSGKITGNRTEIAVLNDVGEKTVIYSMDVRVKNMKIFSNIIAINTGTAVYYINSKGELLGKFDSKTNISEVHFLNRQKTVLVCKSSLIINNI